jgi:ribA/ribD-fused uncharacterized protein
MSIKLRADDPRFRNGSSNREGKRMNIKELRKKIEAGEKFEYEFFWKGPFSQWDRKGFKVDGVFYKTAEHWMMAEKARIFGDKESWKNIVAANHPSDAKGLGRKVKNFNEEKWINERYNVVFSGNVYKFSQDEKYKSILMKTGDKILVEASPVDKIWGIGLAEDNPNAKDPMKWNGLNILGFVLTSVREHLK